MKTKLFFIGGVLLVFIVVGACNPQYIEDTGQTEQPTESSSTSLSTPPHSEDYLLASKTDLAQRLNINIEEINTILVNAVIWSDASLGCPKENTEYAQVLTEGYQIILETGGNMYNYHTDNYSTAILYAWAPANEINVPTLSSGTENGSQDQPVNTETTIESILTTTSTQLDKGSVTPFPSIPFNPKEIIDGQPWRSVDDFVKEGE